MTGSDTHKEIGVVNGIEVVQPAPEVVHHYPGQYPVQYAAPGAYMTAAAPAPVAVPEPAPVQPQSTICGLRKVTFWLAFAIAVLGAVIIAVAIGLGVGLSQRSNNGVLGQFCFALSKSTNMYRRCGSSSNIFSRSSKLNRINDRISNSNNANNFRHRYRITHINPALLYLLIRLRFRVSEPKQHNGHYRIQLPGISNRL